MRQAWADVAGFCVRHPWRAAARALVLGLLIQLWAWALDRAPPRTHIVGTALPRAASPETVDPDHLPAFARGEEFQGRWSMTVHRYCDGRVVRWVTSRADRSWALHLGDETLLNGQGFGDGDLLPMRRWVQVAPFRIPEHAPLGEAAYHVRVLCRCNPLHRLLPITVVHPVIRFRIVEAP